MSPIGACFNKADRESERGQSRDDDADRENRERNVAEGERSDLGSMLERPTRKWCRDGGLIGINGEAE